MPELDTQVDKILDYLRPLIAFNTENPPRNLTKDSEIFAYLTSVLPDFDVQLFDHDDGRVSFYAKRGNPKVLFNVHIDTVPSVQNWSHSPFEVVDHGDTVSGLGVCDIKGAAACLLLLAQQDKRDLALLFTTDEEGANGCCVNEFIQAGLAHDYQLAVVAEPTQCQAVTEHSGFISVEMNFTGVAGHSSDLNALKQSANHHLIKWADNTLQMVNEEYTDNSLARFNLGEMRGGIKSNISSDHAFAKWSARLVPGSDTEAFIEKVKAAIPKIADVAWRSSFYGPPLPTLEYDNSKAQAFANEFDIELGAPVGFWTEASLFNAAGTPAFVLGPGNIEQAHTANEWVAKSQLATAYEQYERISRLTQ